MLKHRAESSIRIMNETNSNNLDINKLVIGLNVILVGVYILLGNIGVISFGYIFFFWRLWPIILIAIGLNIIFRNEGINYLGSLTVTFFLVVIMVASTPGASGTGSRKIMGIPDDPVEFSFDNLWKHIGFEIGNYNSHGNVIQTIEGKQKLPENISSIKIKMEDKFCDRVTIKFIPSTDNQQIEYRIGLKSDDTQNITPTLSTVESLNGNFEIISVKDADYYYDIFLDIHVNPEIDISVTRYVSSFEISGDWMGDVSADNLGSGEFISGLLGGKNQITTTSGSIKIDNIKNSQITTISGTIRVGKCEDIIFKTTSGDIYIAESSRSSFNSTSGSLECNSVIDTVSVKNTSGDTTISKIQINGKSQIHTVSGDIELNNFQITQGDFSIKTISGDVELSFSRATDNSVRGRIITTGGDINSQGLDIKNKSFIIGDGKSDIVIKTTSGDINLRKME